jgi:demethylmenaquinone methyltransferase/2-methoxy-6-polyprenyl-1,4-benzoquinol methylase
MFASERELPPDGPVSSPPVPELPISGGPAKRAYVRAMFSAIAPTYDCLNRVISFRLDVRWRRYAVRQLGWEWAPDGVYLDLCAGTLDFGAALAAQPGFRGRIVGADFAQAMLRAGRGKSPRLRPVAADALELPFPEATFDGAMVGWGIRNLVDLDAGFAEAARVLKPGGRLVILEMTLAPQRHFRSVYQLYLRRVLPKVGRLISKHTTAYTWLPESTRAFPEPPEVVRRMRSGGFPDARYELFLGGVCAMYLGTRA